MHEAELLRRPTAMHIDAARAAAAGDQTEECGAAKGLRSGKGLGLAADAPDAARE